ncbi:MAG TPA: hypothetical protein VH704_02465 [Casimicrobiaceae bacterium]|nr:hypothetical protein [Casimicrobiaceae bacterium]
MLALLPGEPWLRGAGVVIAGVCGIRALRGAMSIGTNCPVVAVDLGAGRRAVLADRSGHLIETIVQPETYVGTLVTTMVLRSEGARRSRALAIWPDTMPPDDLRRLRVLLRHGDRGSAQA